MAYRRGWEWEAAVGAETVYGVAWGMLLEMTERAEGVRGVEGRRSRGRKGHSCCLICSQRWYYVVDHVCRVEGGGGEVVEAWSSLLFMIGWDVIHSKNLTTLSCRRRKYKIGLHFSY